MPTRECRAKTLVRVGARSAGAVLDGREWREFPETGTPEVR